MTTTRWRQTRPRRRTASPRRPAAAAPRAARAHRRARCRRRAVWASPHRRARWAHPSRPRAAARDPPTAAPPPPYFAACAPPPAAALLCRASFRWSHPHTRTCSAHRVGRSSPHVLHLARATAARVTHELLRELRRSRGRGRHGRGPVQPPRLPQILYQDYHMCDPDRVETGPHFVPGLPHVLAHSRRRRITRSWYPRTRTTGYACGTSASASFLLSRAQSHIFAGWMTARPLLLWRATQRAPLSTEK